MTSHGSGIPDNEKTRPPVATLRFENPTDLYQLFPQVNEVTRQRPRDDEDGMSYLRRLRSSTTPEEAITYSAFAALPQMAIWWGYECLRTMPDHISPQDHHLMELIAHWTGNPSPQNRHTIMREALWAPVKSPAVFLGLAVGWSGGSIAPNDPLPVPLHRTPRSINSAILSCLAQAEIRQRPILLARFIDMAESLFRVY